jgi:hypothetical protein
MLFNKLIGLIFLVLLSVISASAQSQQPHQGTVKQKINHSENNNKISNPQNNDTTKPTHLQQSASSHNLQETTDNKSTFCQTNPKRWREILNNPVDVFTGIIAFFTIILVIAGFRQVAISRNTAIRQLRAYIFIDSIGIKDVDANFNPKTTIVIKNSGQTPAYDLSGIAGIDFREYPLASDFDPLFIDPNSHIPTSHIPPGGTAIFRLTHNELLTPVKISQLNDGTHAIYVAVKIIYKDAFGKRRFTRFLGFHNRSTARHPRHLSSLAPYSEGNEAD